MMTTLRNRYISIVTMLYLLFALAWIFLSDSLLTSFSDIEAITWLSTIKGVFFVIITTALFFLAMRAVPQLPAYAQEAMDGPLLATFQPQKQIRWPIYLLAIALPISVLFLRVAMVPGFENRPMLIMFVLPIILSAMLGGLGPGLLSTAIASLGLMYFVIPPVNSFAIKNSQDILQMGFLLVNGIAVSILSEALRQSLLKVQNNRNLLDAIIRGTSDAIFVKDLKGRYVLANESTARFAGKSVQEIIGKDDYALFPEKSARQIGEIDQNIIGSGEVRSYDEHIDTADGKSLVFMVTKGPMLDKSGNAQGLFGIARDITERKEAEAALKESEAAMKVAQRLAAVGSWKWDVRTDVHTWSEEVYAIYGRDPALPPATYPEVQKYFTPESWTGLAEAVEYAIKNSFPYACDAEVVRPDGSHRWIIARGEALQDENGNIIRLHGSVQDITERKMAAMQLQASEERLQMAIAATSEALWDWDVPSNTVYRSQRYFEMTGYTAEEDSQDLEFIKRKIHPDDLSMVLQCIADFRTPHCDDIDFEYRLVTKQGQVKWVHTRGRVVSRDSDGKALRVVGTLADINEKKLIEAELLERERRLERVMLGSNLGYWDWDLRSNTFKVSARWETMLGYEPGEMKVAPEYWSEHIHPDDLKASHASLDRHIKGLTASHELELRLRTKSGEWRWVLTRGAIVEWDAQGKPLIMSGTHTDITAQKMMELTQREAATVFSSSFEGIMVVNPLGCITKINPAFTRITGYTEKEVCGQSTKILASGHHNASFYAEMWNAVKEDDFWRGEIWNKRKNGEIFPELLSISSVRDATGEIQHYIGIFTDVSELKTHEAELDRMAHYDPLTGAPNRRLLADRLGQAVNRSNRTNKSLAVCYLDLDGFKEINDKYGHAVGDRLLIGVTENLKHVLRADDTLARLGGDEFAVLLSDISSAEESAMILDRVLMGISKPIQIDLKSVSISASIGVSLYPDDNVDADTLLRHADHAMYLAKEAGKNRYHLFDPESDRKAQQRRQILERLEIALDHDEFILYYQPKVDLITGEIVGAEALIRWQHPNRGILAPGEFLPHIYGSKLEKPLGEWVIKAAIQQAYHWQLRGIPVRVSANISAHHLLAPEFCDYLQAALRVHPYFEASNFELEVLETAAIADMEQAVAILNRCRQMGIHFSLDDFGTGYSSLTYLRKLPVDTLKIDQSFVRDMLTDVEDLDIVEGVIRLAGAFDRQVIAEGVETMAHGAKLLELGCRLAQGYGIARPMPADQFVEWAVRWKTEARWRDLRTRPALQVLH
ncbi:PAS domain S-box protein [Undibacterium pigrum]|uniref:PAS domain S-box-containing protein/diguanylate cyclase (GGDEF)-like protein n=1 Tax=Undibacterium pigrum TaxID=401470 RepID=A0A318J2R5_9BURK|nr:PAS domain S-box protein [Undibacterium pigrum]PXX41674.1 PAS domain S-box-containing protein/diguanylate cyclase (GGDEF)-like protein [Undibacterium pigrum]